MGNIRFVPKAESALAEIWHSIARHNETAADKLFLRIFDRLELVSNYPEMGSLRPDLSKTARILIEGKYILIYEPEADGILVVAVVHGARESRDWL